MSQFQWTSIGQGSIGTEEEPRVSAEEQLMLDPAVKYDASQTLTQVHLALNVEAQTTGQTNVRLKQDNSI